MASEREYDKFIHFTVLYSTLIQFMLLLTLHPYIQCILYHLIWCGDVDYSCGIRKRLYWKRVLNGFTIPSKKMICNWTSETLNYCVSIGISKQLALKRLNGDIKALW